ncbi:hypothetical protein [Hydrogenophaga taeniospiralis]|uniref:hypothetical protein n=1 Tax=Hydrogenophaga taeniospiralis TaxID=65656 RepID=UPI001CF97C3A|nr:hypothetical protein [Hydrogenophaga taeniospiralis]UCU92069.1 hypothetical protein KI616_14400 [Hydrogenophaga taeniospiralis]
MTAYADFTNDFPRRCLEVLDAVSSGAAANGREITLLFMSSSARFLVPFERLKSDTSNSEHPFGDNKRYGTAAARSKDMLRKKFVGSVLCPSNSHSWHCAKKVASVECGLDSWLPNTDLKAFSKDRQVASILTLFRNALAHGNIYTVDDPIRELAFVKEVTSKQANMTCKRVGFEVIRVSHEDFLRFIRAWLGFWQDPAECAGSQP